MIYQRLSSGIFKPAIAVSHRDNEYGEAGFKLLLSMQERHFWYRGRHRFLLKALDRFMPKACSQLSAIGPGGGDGG